MSINHDSDHETELLVSNIIENILNNVFQECLPPQYDQNYGHCSTYEQIIPSSSNRMQPTYEIYRATGVLCDSESDMDIRLNIVEMKKNKAPIVPPSYSTVMKLPPPLSSSGPTRNIRSSRSMEILRSSFFTRVPPPSYSEVQGITSTELSTDSSEQMMFGPDPVYAWCPRCSTIVITMTHSERSKFTHFTALVLCLCVCWPCCLLPYFSASCKNTYHYCPNCNYLFGMYRPW